MPNDRETEVPEHPCEVVRLRYPGAVRGDAFRRGPLRLDAHVVVVRAGADDLHCVLQMLPQLPIEHARFPRDGGTAFSQGGVLIRVPLPRRLRHVRNDALRVEGLHVCVQHRRAMQLVLAFERVLCGCLRRLLHGGIGADSWSAGRRSRSRWSRWRLLCLVAELSAHVAVQTGLDCKQRQVLLRLLREEEVLGEICLGPLPPQDWGRLQDPPNLLGGVVGADVDIKLLLLHDVRHPELEPGVCATIHCAHVLCGRLADLLEPGRRKSAPVRTIHRRHDAQRMPPKAPLLETVLAHVIVSTVA
eukprot:9483586-Pyramimonas_sp.AAC.3